jgi:hypothetical protein
VSLTVRPDVHSTAEQAGLSGVITESRPGSRLVGAASRYASRALRVRGTMQTRFAMGNGSKGLAALARTSALLYLAIVFDHVTEAGSTGRPIHCQSRGAAIGPAVVDDGLWRSQTLGAACDTAAAAVLLTALVAANRMANPGSRVATT